MIQLAEVRVLLPFFDSPVTSVVFSFIVGLVLLRLIRIGIKLIP